jgi:hypothetical protein
MVVDVVDDQLVLREIAPPDTNLAYAAMRELRTSLSSSEEFVETRARPRMLPDHRRAHLTERPDND